MKLGKYNIFIPWGFTLVVVGIIVMGILQFPKGFTYDIGAFIIISLTLLSVIWYTYFSYKLYQKREQIAISCILKHTGSYDIRVILSNLSKEVLKVEVKIDIVIDEKKYLMPPTYTGEQPWVLTPYNTINGHFSLSDPIKGTDIHIDDIGQTSNNTNKKDLYKIKLTTEWFDNDGNSEVYPTLCWYFDFNRNDLVYVVND